jgi:hypothetical protein
VWSGRAACFGGVCQGVKYVPQNANQNCNAPVQICAQSFDLSQISESTIEAQCNLTASTGTPSSAGDTPSGTPSDGFGDYIPRSLDEIKNDSKKQLAVGGVGTLFVSCCCLLVIILLLASVVVAVDRLDSVDNFKLTSPSGTHIFSEVKIRLV